VSIRVGCVVSDGAAKSGERSPSICVGCVTYVSGRSSSLWEVARGGEEDTIGSRRYIMLYELKVSVAIDFAASFAGREKIWGQWAQANKQSRRVADKAANIVSRPGEWL
jgi:hypothetical protein